MDKAPVEIPYLTPSPNYQAALWTLLSLTLLSTAVRVYCRAHVLKAFGVDDWLITAAAVLAIVFTAFHHVKQMFWYPVIDNYIASGFDPTVLFNDPRPSYGERYVFLSTFFYVLVLGLFKASIFFFYLRFVTIKSQRIFIQVMIGLVATVAVVFFILNLVAYRPLSGFWDPSVRVTGKFKIVIGVMDRELVCTCIQIFFDVVLLGLPLVIFRRVQIPTAKKILLLVVYIFGFVSLAATIARLPPILHLKNTLTSGSALGTFEKNINFTIWTQVELATGIFCANIPALSAFLRTRVAQYGTWRSWRSGSNSSSITKPHHGSARSTAKRPFHRQSSDEDDSVKGLSAAEMGNSGIMRDVEVAVEYDMAHLKPDRSYAHV